MINIPTTPPIPFHKGREGSWSNPWKLECYQFCAVQSWWMRRLTLLGQPHDHALMAIDIGRVTMITHSFQLITTTCQGIVGKMLRALTTPTTPEALSKASLAQPRFQRMGVHSKLLSSLTCVFKKKMQISDHIMCQLTVDITWFLYFHHFFCSKYPFGKGLTHYSFARNINLVIFFVVVSVW